MTRLSETQSTLLSAAAARDDNNLLPPPDGLLVSGVALDRTLRALVQRGLVREGRANEENRIWRLDDEGGGIGLEATHAGLKVIGAELEEPRRSDDTDDRSPVVAAEFRIARPGGKLAAVLGAIEKADGATIDELSEMAGWRKHTTRAALTRLRQRGFSIRLGTIDGRKAYRLESVA